MKVSVITVSYNRGHLIGETISSVLSQTFGDFEYIIVDDGSTDDTQNIVSAFADSRIKYFRHHHTGNLSKLLNQAITYSVGEIIAVIDSDDLWIPTKLERAMAIFNEQVGVKFITHNISYFNKVNEWRAPYYKLTENFYRSCIDDVLRFQILPFPVMLFRREIIIETGLFNESFRDGHQDFLLRVAAANKIYFINEVLSYIRLHPQNMHKKNNNPYFTNYYISIKNLLYNKRISLFQFTGGLLLNSKKFGSHLFHRYLHNEQ